MKTLEDKIIDKFDRKFMTVNSIFAGAIYSMNGWADKDVKDFIRQSLLSYRREIEKEVEELAVDGLLTDGGHHKQWYLEKILKVIGVDLIKLRKELNTPNKKGDYWDWEDGIAP